MGVFVMNVAVKTVSCTLQGAVIMSVLVFEVLFILIPDTRHLKRAGQEDGGSFFQKLFSSGSFCDRSLLDIIFDIITKLMTNIITSIIIFAGLLIIEKLLTKGAATE
jgi:hypothetical protein